MKHLFVLIVLAFLFILPAGHAYADTSVDIEDNGDGASSDVHVDNSVGQSTTNNSTTVCINGKCTTSQDGNVDRQEGGASVHVQNNMNGNQSKPSPPAVTFTPIPSVEKKEASDSAKKSEIKPAQQQQSTLEAMITNLRKFINELFSRNK